MKFKEIKPDMVIHCPKEEDARALLKHMGREDKDYIEKACFGNSEITEFSDLIEPEPKFKVGDKVKIRKGLKPNTVYGLHCYDKYMDSFKNDTLTISEVYNGFDAKEEKTVGFFYYVSEDDSDEKWDEEMLELVENSTQNSTGGENSTMTAKELLEWFGKNSYNGETMREVFGKNAVINDIVANFGAQGVIARITDYEAKKAEKPKAVEYGKHLAIISSEGDSLFAEEIWFNEYKGSYEDYKADKMKELAREIDGEVIARERDICRAVKW